MILRRWLERACGVFFVALAARAGVAQSPPTPAPSSTPAAATGLFGDFGGARSALAARGVTFRGHIVAESAANVSGGSQTGTAFAGEFMVGTDIDLGKLASNALGIFRLTFTAREGSSLSANTIGTSSPSKRSTAPA